MRKADFQTAVKRKLTPNFNAPNFGYAPGAPNLPLVGNPKQALTPNLPARLGLGEIMATGGSLSVADIATDYWFSALQPIQPVAPASYRPRQRAFLPGENMVWTPGDDGSGSGDASYGGVPFTVLRALADSWDLLRLVIETRKDQMGRLEWEIKVKEKAGEKVVDRKQRQLSDPNVKKLTQFFQYPDGFHDWDTWLRMIFEDVLVLDASAIHYERDLQGRIANCRPIDGGTIARIISDLGTTPPPPSVAYQQVVYGSPACDMTTDDMLYIMRNERTNRKYGFSPVAQIFITISIALRRQSFLLSYYTDCNIPEALCFLPSNLPIPRIKEIQDWFDSVLAGNLRKRRRLTFLPGYGTGAGSDNVRPNVVFTKDVLLKDALDEWLMAIVCYAFSTSPQNLMKQMNRASAEQASSVADEEGLEPGMKTFEHMCNKIIEALGMDADYEFAWQEVRDVDPEKQANIDKILCPIILTINETRELRGLDPRPEPEADMLGVLTPTGLVPLGQATQQFQQQQDQQQQSMDFQSNQEDRTQANHELGLQQQQQNLASSKQSQNGPAEKATVIPRGKFVHPVFGDLSEYDRYFAYDPENDLIMVKGDIDFVEAREELIKSGHLKR